MDKSTILGTLSAYLWQFSPVLLEDVAHFVEQGKVRALGSGAVFCNLGQTVHELAFVESGIVRYFVTLPDGREATKDFSFPGSFTLSFGSAVTQSPAKVAIAAVTPTKLMVWPYQTLLDLYDSDARWQTIGRRIAEMLYVRKEERELSFLLLDAQARYMQLRQQVGDLLDLIPQYFIASYLGIQPQSLSRLKKQLGKINLGE